MNIAYVRVSTAEQNEARQLEALKKYNIEKWYVEKISGKDKNRPELKKMIEYAREKDIIYIESFSRLARSLEDLIDIVNDLKQKDIQIVSLKEQIDTTTPQGKLMFSIFGALSEFERDLILQRQREGIEAAKLQGRPYGRKKIELTEEHKEVITKWQAGEITAREAMKLTGLNRDTFYRRIKELET